MSNYLSSTVTTMNMTTSKKAVPRNPQKLKKILKKDGSRIKRAKSNPRSPLKKAEKPEPVKTSVAPSNPTPSPVANVAPPLPEEAPEPEEEDPVSLNQDPPNLMQLGDNQGGTSPPASTIQSFEEELSEDEEGEIRL